MSFCFFIICSLHEATDLCNLFFSLFLFLVLPPAEQWTSFDCMQLTEGVSRNVIKETMIFRQGRYRQQILDLSHWQEEGRQFNKKMWLEVGWWWSQRKIVGIIITAIWFQLRLHKLINLIITILNLFAVSFTATNPPPPPIMALNLLLHSQYTHSFLCKISQEMLLQTFYSSSSSSS